MQNQQLRVLLAAITLTAAATMQAMGSVHPAPSQKCIQDPLRVAQTRASEAPLLRQTSAQSGTFEFSYSNGSADLSFGDGTSGEIQACMRLDLPALRGMKIIGLRVPKMRVDTVDVDWSKVWAATSPSRTHDLAEAEAFLAGNNDKTSAYSRETFNLSGNFETPVTVGDAPIYVGYTLNVPDANSSFMAGYPISADYPTCGMAYAGAGTCLISSAQETAFSDYSDQCAITATIILQKDDQTSTEVSLRSLLNAPVVEAGKPLSLVASVMNTGSAEATSVDYTLLCGQQTFNGQAQLPAPLTPGLYARSELCLDTITIAEAGVYPCTLTLTKVNGDPNHAALNSCTFDLTVSPSPDASILDTAEQLALYKGGSTTFMTWPDYRGVYEEAVRVAHPTMVGMKVVGIKVKDLGYLGMGNYNGWVRANLDEEPLSGRTYGNVDEQGSLTILFPDPVVVPVEGLYVGFSEEALFPNNAYRDAKPLNSVGALPMVLGAEYQDGACWYRDYISNGWMDYAAYGYAAPITVYLAGETEPDNVMLASIASDPVALKDAPLEFNFDLANCGSNTVNNLTYTYTIDDISNEKTITLSAPMERALGQTTTLTLDLGTAPHTQGKRDLKVTVDKVNGNANKCAANSITLPLTVLDYEPHHRPLMEEITGTWCGWCPRGAVGMEELAKEFGEDYVGVSYHNGDRLTITSVYPWDASGLPGCTLDRSTDNIDPFFGTSGKNELGIKEDYLAAKNKIVACDIDLSCAWGDEEHTTLNTDATVRFALDDPSANYKIGYLLTADGYCFPDSMGVSQANYFSGSSMYTQSLLQQLADLPGNIMDYVWNDVVVNVAHMLGVKNSLPSDLRIGESYKHQMTFDTQSAPSINGGYDLMERRDAIKVVAFVLDGNGKVVNAIKSAPGPEVGIHSLDAANDQEATSETVFYNIQGQRISRPTHGLVIMMKNRRATKMVL